MATGYQVYMISLVEGFFCCLPSRVTLVGAAVAAAAQGVKAAGERAGRGRPGEREQKRVRSGAGRGFIVVHFEFCSWLRRSPVPGRRDGTKACSPEEALTFSRRR